MIIATMYDRNSLKIKVPSCLDLHLLKDIILLGREHFSYILTNDQEILIECPSRKERDQLLFFIGQLNRYTSACIKSNNTEQKPISTTYQVVISTDEISRSKSVTFEDYELALNAYLAAIKEDQQATIMFYQITNKPKQIAGKTLFSHKRGSLK